MSETTTPAVYTLEVKEEPETKDLCLEFPDELMDAMNWKVGDVLIWTDLGDGRWQLTKKT
jgi:hypothetical protein